MGLQGCAAVNGYPVDAIETQLPSKMGWLPLADGDGHVFKHILAMSGPGVLPRVVGVNDEAV